MHRRSLRGLALAALLGIGITPPVPAADKPHQGGMQHEGMKQDGMKHEGMKQEGMTHEGTKHAPAMKKDPGHDHHGRHAATPDPSKADYGSTRWSDNKIFQVSYEQNPMPLNQIHSWTLSVRDAAGRPVTGAHISVDGGMPQHDHGLPTAPQVQALEDGKYLLEGMKFHMPGWWIVRLDIDVAGKSDQVTFNLKLE